MTHLFDLSRGTFIASGLENLNLTDRLRNNSS